MDMVGKAHLDQKLHTQPTWYAMVGTVLLIFGCILMTALPFARLSVVMLFGLIMTVAGCIHILAAFTLFKQVGLWLGVLFGILYVLAGVYAFRSPIIMSVHITDIVPWALMGAGSIHILHAFILKKISHWQWLLLSGLMTCFVGSVVLWADHAPFWILGVFLATDLLFQGLSYLKLAETLRQFKQCYPSN